MDDGKLAGSIAIKPVDDKSAVLKKFFVYEPYRDRPHHLGQQLYAALISFAREKGFETLVLDTPKNTERAHKFYLKAGFEHIAYEDLPLACRPPYPVEMCDFFVLHLKHD